LAGESNRMSLPGFLRGGYDKGATLIRGE